MKDILFVLALIVGTGAIDYALDSPVAAVIAIGSAVYMAVYAKRAPACWNTDQG